MRTMWYEFPFDNQTFDMSDQFMFGHAILVAPKIKKALYKQNRYFFPVSEDDSGKWWSIDVYMPTKQYATNDTCWYQYNNKLRIQPKTKDGHLHNQLLENNEYGIYAKGGTILPIKLHKQAQSILRTMLSPIRLDVYLSPNRTFAEGELYLDDGESFNYKTKNESVLIRYTYQNGKLSCQSLFDSSHTYWAAKRLRVTELNIFGLDKQPVKVTTSKQKKQPDFDYNQNKQTLRLRGLKFPVESNDRESRTILELEFV